MGLQKFTRLPVLPICAKKTKAKCCQIELHFACVMALSDAVTALWQCNVSDQCYGTMHCVCVKQSLRLLSSRFPPSSPLRHSPGLDLGHAKGSLHLTFAMTQRLLWPLCCFMGAGVHTELSCRLLSLLWLSLQFSSWKWLIHVVVWGKRSKARFLGLALQILW